MNKRHIPGTDLTSVKPNAVVASSQRQHLRVGRGADLPSEDRSRPAGISLGRRHDTKHRPR